MFQDDRQYMHIGTMVEFAFALVGKLDVINKHSFNDFKLRVGEHLHTWFNDGDRNSSVVRVFLLQIKGSQVRHPTIYALNISGYKMNMILLG